MIPFYNSVNGGPPEPITALSPVAWYRYGVGITEAATLVSAWADQSGNGNDLVQATGTNQPALQSDNSILFDGVDNFMAAAFTLDQPETVYLLFRQVTWADQDVISDGNTVTTGQFQQRTTSPGIRLNTTGGASAIVSTLALNTYGIIAGVFNGASSSIQINNGTPTTATTGGTMGGFTIGTRGGAGAAFSNIQVKEAIVFPVAHDAATRATVITYLATVGGVNL